MNLDKDAVRKLSWQWQLNLQAHLSSLPNETRLLSHTLSLQDNNEPCVVKFSKINRNTEFPTFMRESIIYPSLTHVIIIHAPKIHFTIHVSLCASIQIALLSSSNWLSCSDHVFGSRSGSNRVLIISWS